MAATTITPAMVARAARAGRNFPVGRTAGRQEEAECDATRRELTTAREMIARLRTALGDADRDVHEEHAARVRAEERARRAEQARRQDRKPGRTIPTADRTERRSRWVADEEWVRHEIYLAWVERVPAGDRGAWPLRDYVVGVRFAASLSALDDCQFDKALRAAVDAITGRVAAVSSRRVHLLREGAGGADPACVRPSDGARCWRAAIEQNTASARRLHYWVLPGGRVELSRVVLHDDVNP